MWQTQTSIEIAATPDEVYAYLADLRRHKEWAIGLSDIVQTRGEGPQVGAEYRAEEKIPVRFTSYARLTALEPPGRIEWAAWDGRAFTVDWAFELQASGSGTTVLQTARMQPVSLLGQVLFLVMRKRQVPAENARSLQRLKSILEAARVGA